MRNAGGAVPGPGEAGTGVARVPLRAGAVEAPTSASIVPVGGGDPYLWLRQGITSGRLLPNERLVEVDLAARLGVGRAAVRTYLTRLEQEGLVIRVPHRGARVRMVSEAEAIEITQARAALETLAARQAALRADDADVEEMGAILAVMKERMQAEDLLAYSDGNAQLHAKIIDAARHRIVGGLIAGLKAQVVRFQYRTVLVPGRSQRSYAEHSAIVAAIAARDPDAAEAAMRLHLFQVGETLIQIALPRSRPEPFGSVD